jgi:ABC-type proline/glycine betaine transport system ATPase subunit
MFYSSKQDFFVAGEGLSNTATSTVLAEQVTHLGQTLTLHKLLTSKTTFSFIQHSQSGGCKIICQLDDPTITQSKTKSETSQHPRAWFTSHVIGAEKEPVERLDWSTKKFQPQWSYKIGAGSPAVMGKQSTTDIRKQWTTNWCIQKDDKSTVSKLSSTGKSIKTIWSQLMAQQQANKELTELTVKLKEESSKDTYLHKKCSNRIKNG